MIDLVNFPIDITYQVRHFRDFLVSAWPYLDQMMNNHDWEDDGWFSDDWIQVNWEFLIERELLGISRYLAPLSRNQRITFPEVSATYKIVCDVNKIVELRDWPKKRLNYEGEELFICGFRTRRSISFRLYPPFDFIEVRTLDRKKCISFPLIAAHFFSNPCKRFRCVGVWVTASGEPRSQIHSTTLDSC